MIRNKGLSLLALLVSLITLPPIVLAPAFFGLPIPLALYTGFIIWALLTLLIGNIFVSVFGTPLLRVTSGSDGEIISGDNRYRYLPDLNPDQPPPERPHPLLDNYDPFAGASWNIQKSLDFDLRLPPQCEAGTHVDDRARRPLAAERSLHAADQAQPPARQLIKLLRGARPSDLPVAQPARLGTAGVLRY